MINKATITLFIFILTFLSCSKEVKRRRSLNSSSGAKNNDIESLSLVMPNPPVVDVKKDIKFAANDLSVRPVEIGDQTFFELSLVGSKSQLLTDYYKFRICDENSSCVPKEGEFNEFVGQKFVYPNAPSGRIQIEITPCVRKRRAINKNETCGEPQSIPYLQKANKKSKYSEIAKKILKIDQELAQESAKLQSSLVSFINEIEAISDDDLSKEDKKKYDAFIISLKNTLNVGQDQMNRLFTTDIVAQTEANNLINQQKNQGPSQGESPSDNTDNNVLIGIGVGLFALVAVGSAIYGYKNYQKSKEIAADLKSREDEFKKSENDGDQSRAEAKAGFKMKALIENYISMTKETKKLFTVLKENTEIVEIIKKNPEIISKKAQVNLEILNYRTGTLSPADTLKLKRYNKIEPDVREKSTVEINKYINDNKKKVDELFEKKKNKTITPDEARELKNARRELSDYEFLNKNKEFDFTSLDPKKASNFSPNELLDQSIKTNEVLTEVTKDRFKTIEKINQYESHRRKAGGAFLGFLGGAAMTAFLGVMAGSSGLAEGSDNNNARKELITKLFSETSVIWENVKAKSSELSKALLELANLEKGKG